MNKQAKIKFSATLMIFSLAFLCYQLFFYKNIQMNEGLRVKLSNLNYLETGINFPKNWSNKSIEKHKAINQVTDYLIEQSKKYDLNMLTVSPEKSQRKNHFLFVPIVIDVSGEYKSILKFISSLNESNFLLSINQIHVTGKTYKLTINYYYKG